MSGFEQACGQVQAENRKDNQRIRLQYVPITALRSNPANARKHGRSQITAIANSIAAFGNNAPILVDSNGQILAGNARYAAACLLDLTEVPVIFLDHLSEAQAKAYMLADNKLTDRSCFDEHKLALHLKELSEMVLDFEITSTGFELPEIDIRIQSLDDPDASDRIDEDWPNPGPAVTMPGDLWVLGDHRLSCDNALTEGALAKMLGAEQADVVWTDPPYNLKIDGPVTGKGKIKHRDFAMAAGEMSRDEYCAFLLTSIDLMRTHTRGGAVLFVCMDWRHIEDLLAAGRTNQLDLLNLCIWAKPNAGLGSFYRSQHELVAVFRNGGVRHQNNIQLGRFGRSRSNVWTYAGNNSFPRNNARKLLALHPTVKPLRMVEDALLDCTKPNDLVLDMFVGSGTTILAAERTHRRCYGVELDPTYVDVAIRRWEQLTGRHAHHANGQAYLEMAARRGVA